MTLSAGNLLKHKGCAVVVCKRVAEECHLLAVGNRYSVRIVNHIHTHISCTRRYANSTCARCKYSNTHHNTTIRYSL